MRTYHLAAREAQRLRVVEAGDHDFGPMGQADPRPEMLCFRGQTFALIRHFFELSSQVGRLPSILGREFFRARVSHHAIPSFEDQAVFARDVELSLAKLSEDHAEIITLVGLYDFTQEEVAEMLHCTRGRVAQRFAEGLDCLSEIFLAGGILSESRPDRRQRQVTSRSVPDDIPCVRKKPPASVRVLPVSAPAGAVIAQVVTARA